MTAHTPIEAVTVCVGYGDFLGQVASFNRRVLDRWIVVTKQSDAETRRVCQDHSIEMLFSEDFDREGKDKFAKAHGINTGLRQCHGNGWLLHMDADICLPYDFHVCLEDAQLHTDNIYGCLRVCVPGWNCWQELQKQGVYSRQHGWLTEYRNRPVGCYVGGSPGAVSHGYCPIGFFQLWSGHHTHTWESGRKWYPFRHGGAARTDTMFSSQWDRRNRVLIPELLVFHLEHENSKDGMGHNWNGRKTPRFCAPGTALATVAGKSPYC